MIIRLIKGQNGFYLSKELWGLWVVEGVLTTGFVWLLIYHYFVTNCLGESRDTTARM